MRKYLLLIVCCMLLVCVAYAQEKKDTSVFKDIFERGKFSGNVRSFYMATDNRSPLNNYYAWGSAAALKIRSGKYKGFYVTAGGAAIYNLMSSDLAKPDLLGGVPSRYEAELFDITNPNNKNVLLRFENLTLNWEFKKIIISAGRQELNTPFINAQDGRLRPGCVEGIFFSVKEMKGFNFSGGWIDKISPRSTVNFYSILSSIGIYPQGVGPDGKKSNYHGNLSSAGIAFLAAEYNTKRRLDFKLQDHFVENIFNTAFFEVQYIIAGGGIDPACGISAMFIHQDAVNNGGNPDASKTYFAKGARSNAASAKITYKKKSIRFQLAYTFISGDGRFLFPREWGSEPFYTFMQPERMEGSGNVQALTFNARYGEGKRISAVAGVGNFMLPDEKNFRLNKFGLPSFWQMNAGMNYKIIISRYTFLQASLFYVYKGETGNDYGNYKYVENKVDMSHYNFIVNYYF